MITINRYQSQDVLTVKIDNNNGVGVSFMSIRTLKELDLSGVFIYSSNSDGTRKPTGSIFRICDSLNDKHIILKFNGFFDAGFKSSGGKAVIK